MAALVAKSRAARAAATLLLVASAACTRDFDGLSSETSNTTCAQGSDCVVVCDAQRSCDLTCPSNTNCTLKCAEGVACICTGAGCSVSCTGSTISCANSKACNRGCP